MELQLPAIAPTPPLLRRPLPEPPAWPSHRSRVLPRLSESLNTPPGLWLITLITRPVKRFSTLSIPENERQVIVLIYSGTALCCASKVPSHVFARSRPVERDTADACDERRSHHYRTTVPR
jgi:hypothetical protein